MLPFSMTDPQILEIPPRGGMRWHSRKLLSSPPPPEQNTESTTTYRRTTPENKVKTSRTDHTQVGYNDEVTLRWVGELETWFSQDPHPQLSNPQAEGHH